MSGMNASGNESQYGECYPAFTSDLKCDVILGFRRALALISMGCCVFVVFIIIIFKKYHFLPQRLIMYLSISAFFQAIAYLMGDYHIAYKAETLHHLEGLCTFQGIYTLFFDWMSFLWVCFITINIFLNAIFLKTTKRLEIVYIVLSFAIPSIICCIPFIGSSYGPAGLWCWIRSHRDENAYSTGIAIQFSIFYGPLWFLSIVLVVVLMIAVCVIRHRVANYDGTFNPQVEAHKKLWAEEIKPLVLYPSIYVIILIFPCINRLRLAFGLSEEDSPGANFFFWFMHSLTLTLHGAAYSIVFACDKQTMARINCTNIKAAFKQRWGKELVHEYSVEPSVGDDLVKRKDFPAMSNGHVHQLAEMEEVTPGLYTPYIDKDN